MPIIDQLASASGRRDDGPNRELAEDLARRKDRAGVKELIGLLDHKKRAVRVDAARAVASLAECGPKLVAPYWETLAALLESREQVMAWPAMIALGGLVEVREKELFGILPRLVKGARRGSVIARDHALKIFVRLATKPAYAAKVLPVLLDELRTCPDLQFPAYVEKTLPVVPPERRGAFVGAIAARLGELPRPTQITRVEKALRRLEGAKPSGIRRGTA
jgi:hypothetical protein